MIVYLKISINEDAAQKIANFIALYLTCKYAKSNYN